MIRIERLDDGFLVVDGPWRGAAVSLRDAEVMAAHRANPGRLPAPPPNLTTGGYDEPAPFDPPEPWPSDAAATWYPPNCDGYQALAQRQFEQATGDAACLGSVCAAD